MKNRRVNWFPLFSTHFAGAFNDNLLKNLICFVGVLWVAKGNESTVIMIASALLVLPYIFLSPLAGRISKIMSKRKVMVIAKIVEIPIMFLAVAGFVYQSIELVLLAMMFMGTQSALFSPSKYGLIRDIGGNEGIAFGTGTMEMLTFISILVGTFVAGLVSDIENNQLWYIIFLLVGVAVVGYFFSLLIKAEESATESSKDDTINPIKFVKDSYIWAKKIRGLNMVIFSLGMFWFIASFIQMNLLIYCPQILHLTNTQTSLIMASMAVGIGLGCFAAGAIARKRVEIGLIPIGGIGLSVCLLLIFLLNPSPLFFTVLLILSAFFGGFFKVPLNAWIQNKVEGRKLGDMLAYDNLIEFIFILFSAAFFGVLEKIIGAKYIFFVIAVSAIISTLITLFRIPSIKTMFLRLILQFLGNIIFHFHIFGKENLLKKQGGILAGNHISLLDLFLITSSIPRIMRFVLVQDFFKNKFFSKFLHSVKTIAISQKPNRDELKIFYDKCIEVVQRNELICIFPEGQMSRTGLVLEFKRGIEQIVKITNAPLIPIHMDNVVGSPLSYISGTSKTYPFKFSNLRRRVYISFGEPIYTYISAHQLRLIILELAAQNFVYRIQRQKKQLKSCYKKSKNKSKIGYINQQKFSFLQIHKIIANIQTQLRIKSAEIYFVEEQIWRNNVFICLALLLQQKDCFLLQENMDPSKQPNSFLINNDTESQLFSSGIKPQNSIFNHRRFAKIFINNDFFFTLPTLYAAYQSLNQSINLQFCEHFIVVAKSLSNDFTLAFSNSIPFFANQSFEWYNNNVKTEEIIKKGNGKNTMFITGVKDLQWLYEQSKDNKIIIPDNFQILVFTDVTIPPAILEYFYLRTNIQLHIVFMLPQAGIFTLQTRGFKGKDSTGLIIEQRGFKFDSIGKSLTGIAFKIVNQHNEITEINEYGQLWIKGNILFKSIKNTDDALHWQNTGVIAACDAEGFITLQK